MTKWTFEGVASLTRTGGTLPDTIAYDGAGRPKNSSYDNGIASDVVLYAFPPRADLSGGSALTMELLELHRHADIAGTRLGK